MLVYFCPSTKKENIGLQLYHIERDESTLASRLDISFWKNKTICCALSIATDICSRRL